MKKVLFLLILFSAGIFISNAQTLEEKVIESKAQKVETTRGANPHIKIPKVIDDNNPVPEPKEEKTRGSAYCKVNIDNNTGYSIDVYIDGEYHGTVPAWKNQYSWAIAGKTSLYAETVGGTYYYGPTWVNCEYEFTWKLGY